MQFATHDTAVLGRGARGLRAADPRRDEGRPHAVHHRRRHRDAVGEVDPAAARTRRRSAPTRPARWGPNAIHQLIAPHAWRLPFERSWRDPNRSTARSSGAAHGSTSVHARAGGPPAGGLGRLGRGGAGQAPGVIRVPPDGDAAGRRREPECRSATWATIDRPSPEPGIVARLGGAVEPLEDVRQVGLGDAGALVVDGDHAAVQGDAHGAAAAGSTWPRCRAGWSAPARGAGLALDVPRLGGHLEGQRRARGGAPGPPRCRAPRAARRCRRRAAIGSSRASSTRSPTRVVSSSIWARTSASSSVRASLGQRRSRPG